MRDRTRSSANEEISSIKTHYGTGKLKANESYQRWNNAWRPQQKQSLIVSILQDYPIGEIIKNRIQDGLGHRFEIVDGLQRITALSSYINNTFSLNSKNSESIIKDHQSHFTQSDSKVINKIYENYLKDKIKTLKFNDLPNSLQQKILSTNVNVATLMNWDDESVIEYFRRVQEGTKLSNGDKLYTVQSELTQKVKQLSSNDNTLTKLGLRLDNGENKKGADRIIYQNILEVIYCKLGETIGNPCKLDEYFLNNKFTKDQDDYFNRINDFILLLNDLDKNFLNQKGLKGDLKVIFCLVLFSDENLTKEFKEFILKVNKTSRISPGIPEVLRTEDDRLLIELNKLRSGAHGGTSVLNTVSNLVKNSYQKGSYVPL